MKELSKMVYQELEMTNELIRGIGKKELAIFPDERRRYVCYALFKEGEYSTPLAHNEKKIRDALFIIRQILKKE